MCFLHYEHVMAFGSTIILLVINVGFLIEDGSLVNVWVLSLMN